MGGGTNEFSINALRKSALVAGTGDESIALANRLEKEGYSVAGFLSRNPHLSGRVIADRVVYSFTSDKELDLIQWRLGGVDCIFFPSGNFSDKKF